MKLFVAAACLLACFVAVQAQGTVDKAHWAGVYSETEYRGKHYMCVEVVDPTQSNQVLIHGSYGNAGFTIAAYESKSGRSDTIEGFWHEAGSDISVNNGRFRLQMEDGSDYQGTFVGQWWYGDYREGPFMWRERRLSWDVPSPAECLMPVGTTVPSLEGSWTQSEVPAGETAEDRKNAQHHFCSNNQGRVEGNYDDIWRPEESTITSGDYRGFTLDNGNSFQGVWEGPDDTSGDILFRAIEKSSTRSLAIGYWWNGPVGEKFGGIYNSFFDDANQKCGPFEVPAST